MTIALGLSAAVLWAACDLVSVRVTRDSDPRTALVWDLSGGMLVGVPLWLATAPSPGLPAASALLPALVAAPFYLLGNAAFFLAIRRGSLSVVAPLIGLEGGIAALLAVAVLGVRVSPTAAAALLVAVAGATLAAIEPGRRAAGGAGWSLVSASAFAATFVLLGRSGGLSPVGAVLVMRGSALLLLSAWLPRIRPPALPRASWPAAAALGVLDIGAFSLFAAAAAIGPIPVASVAAAQFATVAALLGAVVLRERLATWQYAGVALTLVGVSVLAAAG
jgi:drug/metabolite transporter (DMT)-like permease